MLELLELLLLDGALEGTDELVFTLLDVLVAGLEVDVATELMDELVFTLDEVEVVTTELLLAEDTVVLSPQIIPRPLVPI